MTGTPLRRCAGTGMGRTEVPRSVGCGLIEAGMQVTGPHACSHPPACPGVGSLLPFRLMEALRSDNHAPAACTALAAAAVPAMLAGKPDSRIAGRRNPSAEREGTARYLAYLAAGRHPTPASRSLHDALGASNKATSQLPEQPLQLTTLVEYAQCMVSVRKEHATAATRSDRYRADPRAYIRIAAVLRERITAGELAPGQATPSITGLCADHGVARQTAAHALHVLQDAGLVYRVPGLGYHVCTDNSFAASRTGRPVSGP